MKFKYLTVILIILTIILTMSAASAQDVNAVGFEMTDGVNPGMDLEEDANQDILSAKADDNQNDSLDEDNKLTYINYNERCYHRYNAPLCPQ